MVGILFFVKRAFWFIVDNWKIVLPAIVLIILAVFFLRWWNRPPRLDEKAIAAAQQAIQKQDREEMQKVLTEIEVQEKQIDANVQDAQVQTEQAVKEAKDKASKMSNEELAAELERRLHDQ